MGVTMAYVKDNPGIVQKKSSDCYLTSDITGHTAGFLRKKAGCMAKRTRNILTITKRLWILQLYWIYAMLMLKLILRRIICTCPDTLRE